MKNIMLKSNFNQNWKFVKGCIPSLMTLKMYGKEADDISLPHDAMIHETPCETTKMVELQVFIQEEYILILKHLLPRKSGRIKR